MAARSFAEAVAQGKAEQEPVDAYEALEQDGFATMAEAEEIAGIHRERMIEDEVDRYIGAPPEPIRQTPAPVPQGDQIGQMVGMMAAQNHQLMQANQLLQQQVMQLTQQLTAISSQLAAGGGGNGAQQKVIKRADQMAEQEQWHAMHSGGGLLG